MVAGGCLTGMIVRCMFGGMSMAEIQKAVRRLPEAKRRRLTTWMVKSYPALTVEELMNRASGRVAAGVWVPTPPTAENIPSGALLQQARRTAARLGLAK